MVKVELENVALMQEISWRKKSRVTWLKEEDHNMRFFHCLVNSHRRNNFISNLSIDGTVTFDQEAITDTIIQESLYRNILLAPQIRGFWSFLC